MLLLAQFWVLLLVAVFKCLIMPLQDALLQKI